MRFEFATAQRIIFGPATHPRPGRPSRSWAGPRSSSPARTNRAPTSSRGAGPGGGAHDLSIPNEPTTDEVRAGAELVAAQSCDVVIGFGGGSAIGAAKAIAVLSTNGGDPLDYPRWWAAASRSPARTIVAIPTTAGTGAEVTRNAVLAATKHQIKASLRSPSMLPRLCPVVDPG